MNQSSEERNTREGSRESAVRLDPAARPRPLRADARRNVERLVAVAREAFAERGDAASLDDIARRAGVGPGTLYRHFPTRGSLIEAVYREGVRDLCDTGNELLVSEQPRDALVDWLRAFVTFVSQKRALAGSLMDTIDDRERLFRESHEMIETTGTALLENARAVGAIRTDVELYDLIRLASAISLAGERSPEGAGLSDRLLLLALDGLAPSGRA